MPRNKKKRRFYKRIYLVLIALAFIALTATIVGTLAYLINSSSIENKFLLGTTDLRIEETFNDEKTEKSDVYFVNDGNADVYVRAKVMIYYQNAEKEILDTLPIENTDYKIEWGENILTDWFEQDGYYYYKKSLAQDEQTSMLIESCKDLIPGDEMYLVVDVITQAIQASPPEAAQKAWSVDVDEKTGDLIASTR